MQQNRTLKTLGIRDNLPGDNIFQKQGTYDTLDTYTKTLKDINTQHDVDPANTYVRMVNQLTHDVPEMSRAQANDYLNKMMEDDEDDGLTRIPGIVDAESHLDLPQDSPWSELKL